MKPMKKTKMAHTPLSPKAKTDNMGTGLKQKIGIMKDNFSTMNRSKNKGKPPKSLA